MRNYVVAATVALILIAAVVSAAVLIGPAFHSEEMQIADPKNDVLLSVGSACPGMIDVEGANFTRNGNTANITVKVADAFTPLGPGESASWEIMVVLENSTDVLKTYIIRVEAGTVGFWCSFWDVEVDDPEISQVTPNGQWLNLIVTLDYLQPASRIEWYVEAIYEVVSGDDVMTSAYDIAPDQGLQTTTLEP